MRKGMFSLAWMCFLVTIAGAGEVGYIEDFALSKNRPVALQQLIPGTEDYYYFHALHYLNSEQFEKAEQMTRPWLEKFGQTPRLTEIQTRYALLTFDRDPQRTLTYLKNRLGLHFDHQRAEVGAIPLLPTTLDPKVIARDTLKASSFTRWHNLENFEDAALDWLAVENLSVDRRRNLLQRLQRPDITNLPKLVADDLAAINAPDFGAYPIHAQMTQAQLEELVKLRAILLNHIAFVNAMLRKLQPNADEDWRHDPKLTKAYLDRLLTFVRRLQPVHNNLKAHVLYHRLVFDRTQDQYDRELFLEYLKLPRQQGYMAKALLESVAARQYPVDLNANLEPMTSLAVVGPDEPLVRSYLKHFLRNADSAKEFEPYINDVYLRHLFAETKIENGLGEPDQWAALLPPEIFRTLKDRIDIDFAPTNRTNFAADAPVRLDVFIKNVPTLLVKIFEINTGNYYRTHHKEVDTDVNLDGLVANVEHNYNYTEPPLRRTPRRFEFPQLNKPGVYVIDFIGSGKSSRALIRKGRLRPLVTGSTAGQKITVVDDANRVVKDAAIWLGGQEFKASEDGTILVPFSTSPGRQPIVISRGDFACLDYLFHQPEAYELKAGIHVDREALLTQRVASVLIRPGLYLNGAPTSIKLLEEVKLRITATDLDGIQTSTEVPNFKLFEDRESIHEFRVPPRLASLNVQLQAKVKSLSQNTKVDLATGNAFSLNGIDRTDKIEDLHLAKFGTDYVIELLGRTGEARQDRTVQLQLKHRDFKELVRATLKTDAQGRVRLGSLPDITYVTAIGPENLPRNWTLPFDQHTYRQVMHARAGEVVSLPYLGTAVTPSREEFALFAMRGGSFQADRFDAIAIQNGMIELRGLTAGDYDLWLKKPQSERIRIRIVDGPVVNGYVLGDVRHLQLPGLKPVQIASLTTDQDQIAVQLRDASQFARVHVFATRYRPQYSAFHDLGRVRDAELQGVYPAHAESTYLIGRNIGDEFRYILDRKGQKKYPGNLMDRPSLLLNPWAVRSTETGEQEAQGGEDFGKVAAPKPSQAVPGQDAKLPSPEHKTREDLSPNFDFLAEASAVLVNLVPDKDGVVKLTRKELGSHAMIHVVAVDPLHVTVRSTTLPEQPAKFLDLRLSKGLDPKGHFTQQKQVSVLAANQPFKLTDVASSRLETYDSLAKVYALYATLTKDQKLAEFAFLLNWPTLKPEEKRTLYSKHACHELHFFLLKKDAEFFRSVVRPALANKKDKTFLDHWLLGHDLSSYAHPWQFARLNTVERILLAQRLPNEPPKTTRHLSDLLRLLPPNPERTQLLFETALKAGELETEGASVRLGFERNRSELVDELKADNKPANGQVLPMRPVLPPAPTAGPMGGGGGMAGRPGTSGADKAKKEQAGEKAADFSPLAGLQLQQRDGTTLRKELGAIQDREKRRASGVTNLWADDRRGFGYRQLYRRLDPTQEWAENNYYKLPIHQQLAGLVPVSAFWLDYAKHDGKSPFLSRHFPEAGRNFTEMMLALSVIDLPFTASKHDVKFDGNQMAFTPAGPVIAFHEEIRPVAAPVGAASILVSQNFYKQGDRFREEAGEKIDKFVADEFVIHTVYGCQVVVTNPTSSRQRLSVLVQTPVGSIPLANGQFTKTVLLDLEPYRTQTIDYFFYFPKPGQFTHFPIHVAKNEAPVAFTQPFTFNVVSKPTKIDTESWDYVSQYGTTEQVIALLNRENVSALDLGKIAFRMKDRAFFDVVIQLLQDRHVYHPVLWSYALYHNAVPPTRQYLLHAEQFIAEAGGPLDSPLLTVDPVARYQYEHLEYKPLVNARVHPLGKRRQIVNAVLLEQYHRFLKQLSYKQQPNDDDLLAITYYLLLQDRIEEVLNAFGQVNADKVATKMQYDYTAAYLDLYSDDPLKAKGIAAAYANHPVDRWRNAFAAITNYLAEVDGQGAKIIDAEDRTQRQGELASKEPSFEFTLDSKAINLTWQNIDAVKVNYYLMDVELLFSRNPFVQQSGSQFASIKPNATQDVKLPKDQTKLAIPLPEELARKNVLVEVTSNGKTVALPYYANAMNVRLMENYGQLTVTDAGTGKALSKVYVKTYVRLADGQVKFHKDGYTDYRGKFDYSTVSTPEKVPPTRFALLVLSELHGAQIKEVNPPQQ